MSEYYRVLKRLRNEEEGLGAIRPPEATERDRPSAEKAEATPEQHPPRTRGSVSLRPKLFSPAYATLYDNLRATANGHPTRSLVFAGASATDPVRTVAAGVAAHVRRLTLNIMMAELVESNGRPLLRARPEESDAQPRNPEPLPLDLRSHAGAGDVKSWLEENAADADLVLIEGSSLNDSLDSALLGCACDGLVLVAQTELTARDALYVAAERARAVGCRPLGIAMYGTKDRLPGWARRFFHHYRRPLTASEKP